MLKLYEVLNIKRHLIWLVSTMALLVSAFYLYVFLNDQTNSYVRFEGRDTKVQFIEYKPNSFRLREQLELVNGDLNKAVINQLNLDFENYKGSLFSCAIRHLYGQPSSSILAQLDCVYSE